MSNQSIVKTETATPALWNDLDDAQAENLNGGVIKIKNFFPQAGSTVVFIDTLNVNLYLGGGSSGEKSLKKV